MKTILTIILMLFTAAFLNAQVLNPGFENWTAGNPDNWWTDNITGLWTPVVQSTTAHGGSLSAKGQVVLVGNDPVGPAIMSGSTLEGFPINSRVRALKGWYQLNSVEGDYIQILAVVYKSQTTIGAGEVDIVNSTASWTNFQFDIDYINPSSTEVPDEVMIEFVLAENSSASDVHVGSWFLIDDIELSDVAVGVNDGNVVNTFNLKQNYPNPFNPSTIISYSTPSEGFVSLKVYDILGKAVSTLVNEDQPAGNHSVNFNAEGLSNGLYFYELRSGDMKSVKKMMLMK